MFGRGVWDGGAEGRSGVKRSEVKKGKRPDCPSASLSVKSHGPTGAKHEQNTDKTEEGMTEKDGKKNGSEDPPLQEKADSSGKEPPSE